ncbi:conserved hypothetical protein [Cupriavidus taiwanensis]|uniref:hypothetical protein n=1 Tax=Cupriavidus taiwanensis TaxID=164546 RepID=UPI000E1638D0|nr:hypothetical protein [Cupriavidus taiwanensis]SPA23828.1 conserved hypothetical protein [Cupriavidus taiwanensis]
MQKFDEAASRKTSREELVAAWLRHFGVDYPEELDLGTLQALAEFVNDGCPPPPKQSS